MGLVKNRRLKYPPLAGADDPWGSRQAERCECRAMQKQQRAKASKPRFAIIDTRNRKKFFRAVIEFPGSGDPDEPWEEPWEEQGEEE